MKAFFSYEMEEPGRHSKGQADITAERDAEGKWTASSTALGGGVFYGLTAGDAISSALSALCGIMDGALTDASEAP